MISSRAEFECVGILWLEIRARFASVAVIHSPYAGITHVRFKGIGTCHLSPKGTPGVGLVVIDFLENIQPFLNLIAPRSIDDGPKSARLHYRSSLDINGKYSI